MCEIASSADVLNLIPLSEFLCVFSGRMTFIFFSAGTRIYSRWNSEDRNSVWHNIFTVNQWSKKKGL